MDADALRDALDRWTDEGIIDDATAARIREFEDVTTPDAGESTEAAASTESTESTEPTESATELAHEPDTAAAAADAGGLLGENRIVVALALMGGVLVAAGVAAFLIERWESIPAAVRAVVLVGVPAAAAAGAANFERTSPRTAHGLWLLAALFTGVSLFQLAELAAPVDPDAAEPWLVGAWVTVAVVVAARIDSRPIGALASVLGAAAVVAATGSESAVLLVGVYGGVAYAAGLLAGGGIGDRVPGADDATVSSIPRFAGTLRWTGGTFAVVAVVPLVATGSQPWGSVGGGTLLVAAAAVSRPRSGLRRAGRDRRARYAVVPAVVGPLAVATAWSAAGTLESFAGALVALGCLLAGVFSLVVGAVGLREASLANAATLGFVLGIVAFLVGPVADAVSGSIALVAAGLILLVAGLGAERGRRAVLARIG
ncbi:DUF2157 domain-containing protein [Halorubrum sp. CBA1125]|uniref:DUF2157 domain-containing protein n=1 Tax=Halorubrum sp. CBA1125 TaxID=2668072 RepID=UPI0012E710F3|nr:DUF2157 domain-containing protein [Halorubrum sp. CBA1125]MUW14750.1 DUF2157 domain-containing protein [Halorubrum sp. CBA1125]